MPPDWCAGIRCAQSSITAGARRPYFRFSWNGNKGSRKDPRKRKGHISNAVEITSTKCASYTLRLKVGYLVKSGWEMDIMVRLATFLDLANKELTTRKTE